MPDFLNEFANRVGGFFTRSFQAPQVSVKDTEDTAAVQELRQIYLQVPGITPDEAETAALRAYEIMQLGLGFNLGIAAAKTARVASRAFNRVVSREEFSRVTRKLFAELERLEPKLAEAVKKPALSTIRRFFSVPTNVLLTAILIQQIGDWFVFGIGLFTEALRGIGLGSFFDNILFKRIGATITPNQAEDVTRAFHQEGFTEYFDPVTNERIDLTPEHTLYVYERSRQELVARGEDPKREEVLRQVRRHVGKGGKRVGPADGEKAATPFELIRIEGLTVGQILVPPAIVERITNLSELKEIIKKTVAEFLNQIDDRLSFEIQRVKVWVAPGGRVITPNPPSYIEREKRGDVEISRIVQNRIVVLNAFFTTHENKRQKIFSVPLDYSVADTVITGPPPEATEPLPVIIDVIKQIIAPPVAAAAAPAAPAAPKVQPLPTPPPGAVPGGAPSVTAAPPSPAPAAPVPVPAAPEKPKRFTVRNISGEVCTNFRHGPGLRFGIIACLTDGVILESAELRDFGIVQADGFGWARAKHAGRDGWVTAKNVALE